MNIIIGISKTESAETETPPYLSGADNFREKTPPNVLLCKQSTKIPSYQTFVNSLEMEPRISRIPS